MLPALAHWFGIRPADLDDMTYGETQAFLDALKKLPPIGGVVMMEARR